MGKPGRITGIKRAKGPGAGGPAAHRGDDCRVSPQHAPAAVAYVALRALPALSAHVLCSVVQDRMGGSLEGPRLTELKQCVVKRKWVRSIMRTNLGGGTHFRNGWNNLKQGVWSNTERRGRILELCQDLLGPHITEVCCNRSVHCGPHVHVHCTGI